MSHLPEREEKICLNCNASLIGRYCHACGQENVPPKESLWHLTTHFFNDFTHFDGKFFSTLKVLLFRPGFLTTEYMKGRRAAYLNPIRMFLFVSFVTFLVIFSAPDEARQDERLAQTEESPLLTVGAAPAAGTADSLVRAADTSGSKHEYELGSKRFVINTPQLTKNDTSIAAYNARMASLPEEKRHNRLERYVNRKFIAFNLYAEQHPDTWEEQFWETAKHSIPKMFFVTLPFFALFLYLLYLRRRQQFYYSSHGIFSLHYYTAAYIIITVYYLLEWIAGNIRFAGLACFLLICIYLYMAMLNCYRQGWFKTFLKFVIVSFLAFFFAGVLTLIFFMGSLVSLAKS